MRLSNERRTSLRRTFTLERASELSEETNKIDEVDPVAELWWKRGWLAVASMMGSLAVVGWSVLSDSKRLDALQQENGRLQWVLRMAERKNRDLRETLAPLLKSAAQKLPGEKLNASPKKPFERHEADRPGNRPFVPALVSIRFETYVPSPSSPYSAWRDGTISD